MKSEPASVVDAQPSISEHPQGSNLVDAGQDSAGDTWTTLLSVSGESAHKDEITADEFLRRSAPHELDAQRGTAMLWLVVDDGWKRRATEEIWLPRIHAVQTAVHVDVDVSVIRRQGVRPDADNLFWLPILASPADTPAILSVVDESGASAPRLTQYETRWCLSAALADLVVRSARTVLPSQERRDVELLLAARLRRMLNRTTATANPDDPFDDDRAPSGQATVDQSTAQRTAERIRVAQLNLKALFPQVGSDTVGPEQAHVVQLIDQVCSVKLLFVGCDASTRRASFSASMPIREAQAELPVGSNIAEDRYLGPLARKVLREGPGPGRATYDLALSAFSASPNYHVVINLPPDTEATDASLDVDWKAATRLASFLARARITAEHISRLKRKESSEDAPSSRVVVDRLCELLRRDLAQLHDLERSLEVVPRQNSTGPRHDCRDKPAVAEAMQNLATRLSSEFEATEDDPTGQSQLDEIAADLRIIASADTRSFDQQRSFPMAERTPERIHLNVRSNEQLPADADISSARVRFKIYLADPLPHSATNLVNRLNLYVVALIGILATATTWLTAEDKMETGAAVAVLLVFTGILAARIERPGRTSVRGWLARTPYVLGFFSTAPAVLASVVLVTSIWEVPTDKGTRALILGTTFVAAAFLQALLLIIGVAALGSAIRWTSSESRGGGGAFGHAAAWLRRVTPSKLVEALWFTPDVRSELPAAVHVGDAISRLRSREIRNFLAEMLARNAGRPADRVFVVSMNDTSSELMHFLGSPLSQVSDTGFALEDGAEQLDISGALGVSFAGYALVHIIAAATGGKELGTARASRPGAAEVLSFTDYADHIKAAPIRSYHEIFELMICIDERVRAVPAFLRQLADNAASRHLPILLLHFPAIPPRWPDRTAESASDTWVRVRIGVSLQHQQDFFDFVAETAEHADGLNDIRVMTVAEFHRPRPDATADRYLAFPDPSLDSARDQRIGFLMAHAVDRTGLISDVLAHLASREPDGGHLDQLRGASFATASGLGLLTCYFDGDVATNLGETATAAMRSGMHIGHATDVTAFAKSFRKRAWPDQVRQQRQVEGPVLRLTWNTPDRPGVLHALLNSLNQLDRHRPNLLYVLSKVANVNSSQGRLLFRIVLEGKDQRDRELQLQQVVQQITSRSERALTEFSYATDPDSSGRQSGPPQRDVFVTVEVMRTTEDIADSAAQIDLRVAHRPEDRPAVGPLDAPLA